MAQAFLWVCAGCVRGADDSTEYYSRLGIEPSASEVNRPTQRLLRQDHYSFQAEIRQAWRRVSLSLHPDKIAQRGRAANSGDASLFAAAVNGHLAKRLCAPSFSPLAVSVGGPRRALGS